MIIILTCTTAFLLIIIAVLSIYIRIRIVTFTYFRATSRTKLEFLQATIEATHEEATDPFTNETDEDTYEMFDAFIMQVYYRLYPEDVEEKEDPNE